jgi:hypothetical protein
MVASPRVVTAHPTTRGRALALACACALLTASCSYVFVHAPDPAMADTQAAARSCTDSTLVPSIDAIAGVLAIAGAGAGEVIDHETSHTVHDYELVIALPLLVVGIAYLVAASHGQVGGRQVMPLSTECPADGSEHDQRGARPANGARRATIVHTRRLHVALTRQLGVEFSTSHQVHKRPHSGIAIMSAPAISCAIVVHSPRNHVIDKRTRRIRSDRDKSCTVYVLPLKNLMMRCCLNPGCGNMRQAS